MLTVHCLTLSFPGWRATRSTVVGCSTRGRFTLPVSPRVSQLSIDEGSHVLRPIPPPPSRQARSRNAADQGLGDGQGGKEGKPIGEQRSAGLDADRFLLMHTSSASPLALFRFIRGIQESHPLRIKSSLRLRTRAVRPRTCLRPSSISTQRPLMSPTLPVLLLLLRRLIPHHSTVVAVFFLYASQRREIEQWRGSRARDGRGERGRAGDR